MFDKNYMGHELIEANVNHHTCIKCNDLFLYIVWKNKGEVYYQWFGEWSLNILTCEKTIIKNIIE